MLNKKMMMHIKTGSVDTDKNWNDEYPGCLSEKDEYGNKILIEVEQINGEWVEVYECPNCFQG